MRRELKGIVDFVRREIYFGRRTHRRLLDHFHRLYYDSKVLWETTWFGHNVVKCPFDLWVYQEILHETRPQVVVETGTFAGGSALYLANLFDLMGEGRVITVDLGPRPGRPKHPRITYVAGSSTAPEVVARVKELVGPNPNALVLLDSDHSAAHVGAELDAYANLVPVGGYMVVEDSNVNGHPVLPSYGPGPWEAVDVFLKRRRDFEVDRRREKFFVSMNPRGFLRRTRKPTQVT